MQSDLEIKRHDLAGVSVLNVGGYLDAHTAAKFEASLQELVDEAKYNIVINFKNLEFISSAGLGVIMGFIEEIRNNDGDVKLAEINDQIYRIFDLVGFPTLYQIFKTEQEAVDAFSVSGDGKGSD